ncbi:hypothetical protein EYC84_007523 [Monilinia fructicola]|uniref:Uncharacterized protein n=1 Tax=Monilinia fructicola TaxID=38448 RepID=A0A5M9JL02_MONFR|nr:hypothetical protein EYC84_007523 [Monilinia fructicola]
MTSSPPPHTTLPTNSNHTTTPISTMPTLPSDAASPTKIVALLNAAEPTKSHASHSRSEGIFRSEYEYLLYLLPPNFPQPAPPIGCTRILTCCRCKFATAFPGEPHLDMHVSRFCKGGGRGKEGCHHRFCEGCVWGVVTEGEEINVGWKMPAKGDKYDES